MKWVEGDSKAFARKLFRLSLLSFCTVQCVQFALSERSRYCCRRKKQIRRSWRLSLRAAEDISTLFGRSEAAAAADVIRRDGATDVKQNPAGGLGANAQCTTILYPKRDKRKE